MWGTPWRPQGDQNGAADDDQAERACSRRSGWPSSQLHKVPGPHPVSNCTLGHLFPAHILLSPPPPLGLLPPPPGHCPGRQRPHPQGPLLSPSPPSRPASHHPTLAWVGIPSAFSSRGKLQASSPLFQWSPVSDPDAIVAWRRWWGWRPFSPLFPRLFPSFISHVVSSLVCRPVPGHPQHASLFLCSCSLFIASSTHSLPTAVVIIHPPRSVE